MLRVNSSLEEGSLRSSNHSQSKLASREITTLWSKKKEIMRRLEELECRAKEVQLSKQEMLFQKHVLTTIEIDIEKIKQNLEQLQDKYEDLQQQKLSLVIAIQDKELQIDCLGRNLVQCYRYSMSQLDQLRLRLIQLEDNEVFKAAEPLFSIRKSILMFLKDRLLLKQEYRHGIQLEISVNRKSEEFKWFMVGLIKEREVQQERRIIECITQYAGYLKEAEAAIEGLDSGERANENASEVQEANRLELIQSFSEQRSRLAELELKVKDIGSRGIEVTKRISDFKQMAEQRKRDKKEALFRQEMLREKIRCLEAMSFKLRECRQELAEVDEAIEYFSSKQVSFENSKLHINSSTDIHTIKRELCSPSSCTSLPLCESMAKSQFLRSPAPKLPKPSSKLLISSSSHYRSKLSSPSSWK